MPVYFAEGRAAKEQEQFESDLLMLESTLQRFQELYPYTKVQCRIDLDHLERDRVLRQRYTYGTNIHF